MVQKRDSGFSAIPLCLHSGCAPGSLVAESLLKFLHNTGAEKSILESLYNRFRSFRFFFLSIIPLFFLSPSFSHIMSALRRPHSVSTPVVRPVRLWRSCYWNSITTTRAQGNRYWKSYTTGFDIIFVFSSSRVLFCGARRPLFFLWRRASPPFFFCVARRPPFFCVARRPLFLLPSRVAPFFSASRVARFFFSHVARLGLFHHIAPSLFILAVCGPVCLYRFA